MSDVYVSASLQTLRETGLIFGQNDASIEPRTAEGSILSDDVPAVDARLVIGGSADVILT